MARVKKVEIRNLLGIRELEFEPGKVTRIVGKNASGKSSVLEAIKSIVDGGHDATLLRAGEDEGEVVLVLDDDVEVRKTVTKDKSTLDVRHPEFGKISAPKTYVEKLIDATSFNPVAFLTASNRVEILLEALSIEVEAEQLEDALSPVFETCPDEVKIPDLQDAATLPAIDAIERVRGAVYDARTGVNRIAKDKSTTAKELTESLPADGAEPDAVQAELDEAVAKLEAERSEIEGAREEIREKWSERIEKIGQEADRKVQELEDQIREIRDDAARQQAEAVNVRTEELEDVREDRGEEVDRWADVVSTLRERLRAAEGAERTRALIEGAETEAERRETESAAMTDALSRLDKLKASILETLPIEGAEIQDGELYVDGVAFDRLNSAKRVEIVFEIAKMRAGDLGLVVVDDLELLDGEHFEAMVEAIEGSELQAIVTRVTDDSLEIYTEGNGGPDD